MSGGGSLRGALSSALDASSSRTQSGTLSALLRAVARITGPAARSCPTLREGDTLACGRLRVKERRGAGATGIVYEAYDEERAANVALKQLWRLDAASILAFKREFRTLADVEHPNLVRFHELFAEGEHWFFSMELIDGVPFDRWVRPHGNLDERRLRRALEQLVLAVNAIHDAGVLHRDLKPSNVLVTTTGRVVVLDFGLAAERALHGGAALDLHKPIAGTPAYMAPEQAGGCRATPASDLYAIGVMLYEVLTGKLPFEGPVDQLLAAKQQRAARWPLRTSDAQPIADLTTVCMQLLARSPAQRPDGLALRRRVCASAEATLPTADVAGVARSPAGVALLGRAAELRTLSDAYASTLQGKAVLVVVDGESGVGKSALCAEFLNQVQKETDAVVLSGRCYERENVPFKAFDALVDKLARFLRGLTCEKARALLPEDAPALVRLFPALRSAELPTEAEVHDVQDPAELRRRGFAAFGALLDRVREDRPLIMHIDDVQWTCRDSAIFLRQLLVRDRPTPALIIFSHRSEDAHRTQLLDEILRAARSNAALDVRSLSVERLDPQTTSTLAHHLLSTCVGDVTALVAEIARESVGNPFFVTELASFACSARQPRVQALTLNALLSTRLQGLPAPSVRLLQILAVAGQPLPIEIALTASDASYRHLDALRAGRLLHGSTDGQAKLIQCYHDSIREVAWAEQTEEERRTRFQALAMALSRNPRPDPELLFRCLLEADGDRDEAIRYALLAAEQAAATLAFERASSLYQKALELAAPSGTERLALLIKLAQALASAGHGGRAAAAYREAAQLAQGAARLDLRRSAAEQMLAVGNMNEGVALLHGVCDELGVFFPTSDARALASLASTTLVLRLRGLGPHRARAQHDESHLLRLDVLGTMVSGLSGYLPLHAASAAARYLHVALQAGNPEHLVRALGFNAHVHAFVAPASHWARLLCERMEAAAAESDDPRLVAFGTLITGAICYCQGSYREARQHLTQALSALRGSATFAWDLDAGHVYDQFSALVCGDYEHITRSAPSLIDDALRRGRVWTVAMLSGLCSMPAWLAQDDPAGYLRQIEEAKRYWKASSTPQWPDYFLSVGEAMHWLYVGAPERACALLERQKGAYERSLLIRGSQTANAWYALHRGTCAAAALRAARRDRSSSSTARATLNHAVGTLSRAGQGQWQSHVCAFKAALALDCRQDALAITQLRAAVQLADRSATSMYAAAARYRLGQLLGGSQGAELVARGRRFMSQQGVRDCEAMSELLCPGCQT